MFAMPCTPIPLRDAICDASLLSPFVYPTASAVHTSTSTFYPTPTPSPRILTWRPLTPHRHAIFVVVCRIQEPKKKKKDGLCYMRDSVSSVFHRRHSPVVYDAIVYNGMKFSINGHTYLHLQTHTTWWVGLRTKKKPTEKKPNSQQKKKKWKRWKKRASENGYTVRLPYSRIHNHVMCLCNA